MGEYKFPIFMVLIIALVIFMECSILHWLMSDRVYSGSEAAAQCGAAGKRVGTYAYDYGRTTFTCVDAPVN